jgi:glycerol uptake facilitator-like aquaporin
MTPPLTHRLMAEAVGTAFLLMGVIGSGIMGETLAAGNDAVALLGNTAATGAILFVLITIFGPVSGAHFNPAVTVVFLVRREMSLRDGALFIAVQVVAGLAGAVLAHLMFDQALVQESVKARTGVGQWVGEIVATFGLVATILGCVRFRPSNVAAGVGLYITAGYWFTSSTSFANPAVTIARTFTDTFSGIAPVDAPAFVAAQLTGALLAAGMAAVLFRAAPAAE